MNTSKLKGPAGMMHVDDGGNGGMPVLFVHSFAGDLRHWSSQLQHLRKTRRAIAFDLRGHGQSDPSTRDDYSIESLAEDIRAVVEGLNVPRFVLVGHSLGGAASLAYAGKEPGRAAGLVLVAAPGKLPEEQAGKTIASLEADYEKTMEGYWTQLVANAQPNVSATLMEGRQQMPRDRSLKLIKATFEYDPLPALRRYSGPRLFVTRPDDDQPFALHNLDVGSQRKVISGTSHWLQMDKPDEFNRILDEFIASVETGRAQQASGN